MDAPKRTIAFAKTLRRRMDLPEGLLWRALRKQRLEGFRFRRQHPIDRYVLDFYCPEAQLAVEVDGYSHGVGDRPARDEIRDGWLMALGVVTLRLAAVDVLDDLDGVLTHILAVARDRLNPQR